MAKTKDFASILAALETTVAELDSDIPIEKALDLFERGMKLSSECEKFLNAAEQRVEVLKRLSDGSTATEPYTNQATDPSQLEVDS